MKVVTILGTRPEIIKLSPLIPLLDKEFDHILIHTGQHYSYQMDKIFFEELKLRECDYILNVGSATHAQQTANMMIEIEEVLLKENPDMVLVQGDTNSTLAGAITSSKLNIKVVHVEAGCRSFDKNMPEEINRILVDHCSDILFAPDENSFANLKSEGIKKNKIHLVGNTSIDACLRARHLFNKDKLAELGLEKNEYALMTLHRQENTGTDQLKEIMDAVNKISHEIKIIFPVHFRTLKILKENNFDIGENIILTEPLGYGDFVGLLSLAKFVMTDSGGIQEESAVLNTPCLILRENTEWNYLVDLGKNMLVGTKYNNIVDSILNLLMDEEKLSKMRNIKFNFETGVSESIISLLKS